jgi:hypothetical protein
VEQQANFRDMEDLPQQFHRTVGMQEAEEDPKQKNKERQEPRTLLPSTERATYADLADEVGQENYMLLMPCIANRALPYTMLLQMNAVAVENNEYLLPNHIEYLRGPNMRQHARWFGIRPTLPSLTLGGEQQHQQLRQFFRMVPQGEDDPLHRSRSTATDKLLYANQVLQPHNGLDSTTEELGGEWPVQMDAATSSKMLNGHRDGGNKLEGESTHDPVIINNS